MKVTTIAVISLVLLLALAGSLQAQVDCDSISIPWPTDIIEVVETTGRPGDTVLVPLYLTNTLPVAAFEIYIEFDTNMIEPLIKWVETRIITTCTDWSNDSIPICLDSVVDTFVVTEYEWIPMPRFDTLKTLTNRLTSETDFISTSHQRVKFLALPHYDSTRAAIDTTTSPGIFVKIPFIIDSNAAHNSLTEIRFWKETVLDYDSIPPIPVSCIFSHYSDPLGRRVNLTTVGGNVLVDINYVDTLPVINEFIARPSAVQLGQQTWLIWDVSNATSININGTGFDTTLTTLVDSTLVTPTEQIHIYTLTATNALGSSQAFVGVSVTTGPLNDPPVFTQPTQLSYTVDQGQTLAFQVSATDADGDTISLSPVLLPNNATFGPTNPVIGIGNATADFSFTPDFSQMGGFQVTFSANDGMVGGNTQLTISIQVNELQFDRLFTTSAEGQLPVGGLAGTPSILLPINLVTSQTVYGVQFDFLYDANYFEVDSIITTPRTQDYVVYDNIGAIPGEIRVVTFGVANEPIVSDTNTAILYIVMTIDTSALPGDYAILIEDGWESINPDPNFPSLPLVTDSGIIQVDYLGDVNLDKRIDVADAVNVVGNILGNYTFNSRQFATADVVTNSSIDVLDLVGIVNLIFGIPLSPTAGQFVGGEIATVSLDYSDVPMGTEDIIVVRSELPEQIAGVQLEILYDPSVVSLGPPALGEDAARMVLASKDNGHGKYTVLLYFKNPFRTEDLIQTGDVELLKIPIVAQSDITVDNDSQMKLTRALLSTASSEAVRVEGMDMPLPSTFVLHQNYPNPFNPTTTIEFSLGGDGAMTQHVTLDIYNILGQHVKTLMDEPLPQGNYQVEWDATSSSGQRIATGIYLYKLQVGQESESKKMLLLK